MHPFRRQRLRTRVVGGYGRRHREQSDSDNQRNMAPATGLEFLGREMRRRPVEIGVRVGRHEAGKWYHSEKKHDRERKY